MALLKPSEPAFMTAEGAARRRGYAARSELFLRQSLEAFARGRWPEARMCHEMVMGARQVRADMVAIGASHIAAFEIKGAFDDTSRLMHQVGMYQLCVPEVWIVTASNHIDDARMIRHLIPSVGLIVGAGISNWHGDPFEEGGRLEIEAEAAPRQVVPTMMLEMLWASELTSVCAATMTSVGKKPTRPKMIKALLDLDIDRLQTEVCRVLRGRDALWRADPPIRESAA